MRRWDSERWVANVLPATGEITRLLTSWHQGSPSALDELFPLIRRELQRIALRQLRHEQDAHADQPSSLIQEAFVRLLSKQQAGWQNRGHFFAVASTVMRHVLVDHARGRLRAKRGGAAAHVSVDSADALSPEHVEEVVAIDLALQRLAECDERKSRIFELRFFGGLTLDETAEALGIGTRTVGREWRLARAWLRRELSREDVSHGSLAAD